LGRLIDHLTLGHLALTLAEQYDGLIDMDGAITPPLRPGGNSTLKNYPWHTLEEIHEFVQAIPGTVHEIYYEVNPARQWVFHIVDTVFLKNWLKHPHFHMMK
jgi:hypothetical protein